MAAEQVAPRSSRHTPSRKRAGGTTGGTDGNNMDDGPALALAVGSPMTTTPAGQVLSPESPKRATQRVQAASPSAPTRDMTLSELTHAFQHLAAQSDHDKVWCAKVEKPSLTMLSASKASAHSLRQLKHWSWPESLRPKLLIPLQQR